MKNYERVIKERYDKQKYGGGVKNNPYAIVNPIGFYGEFKAAQILSDFVNGLAKIRSLEKLKICDCGCGDGVKTRFLAELLGNPNQVYGIEYSKNRWNHCKNMNPAIHYQYADFTKEIPFDTEFDGIISFVVFMHFATEKDIIGALKNIYNALGKRGMFLWYELDAPSHWEKKPTGRNEDHRGFSVEEMDKYAGAAGLKLVKGFDVYSCIPGKTSTYYAAKNIWNVWVLEVIEKLPLKKTNHIRIYRKE